ncbi:MAG: NAD-dependent epimerase/dehydratase family protein, partial [Candidatus Woesebacteria bacterium]|nr:NAD-dependent epimerase/dehydratase family protein [Candidatus Woesebacteria bacterium]
MKSCVVTGGAGFIGSHLTTRLLDLGYKVTVIDDFSEGKRENLPAKHPNLKIIKASILDNVGKYVKGADVIFHLAALPRLQRSLDAPWKTHMVNVDG